MTSTCIFFSKQEKASHALWCLNAYWFHRMFISCATESQGNTKVKSPCYGNDTLLSSKAAVVLTQLHHCDDTCVIAHGSRYTLSFSN